MKKAAITLVCGLVCVGLGAINLWLGILAVPIMLGLANSLRSE
jgi:hypothetical protein